MVERNRPQPLSSEDIKQQFREHLLSIEFGSTDYLAFCAFYALEQQRSSRRIEIGNLMKDLDIEQKLLIESQLRITENRIAILETEIDRQKTTDVNYFHAYDYVEKSMGQLRATIFNELVNQYPESADGTWMHTESADIYQDTLTNDFGELLFRLHP